MHYTTHTRHFHLRSSCCQLLLLSASVVACVILTVCLCAFRLALWCAAFLLRVGSAQPLFVQRSGQLGGSTHHGRRLRDAGGHRGLGARGSSVYGYGTYDRSRMSSPRPWPLSSPFSSRTYPSGWRARSKKREMSDSEHPSSLLLKFFQKYVGDRVFLFVLKG